MQNNVNVTPEQQKKMARKQELIRKKIEEFQMHQEMKAHESKYLMSVGISEEELVPFIEEQLEKEMQKRNKTAIQLHKKMQNNTSYAKKIVDKAIKEFKKCQKAE